MIGVAGKWPRRGLTRGHIPDASEQNDSRAHSPPWETCAPVITHISERKDVWRRPVGRAGRGPWNRYSSSIRASDYDPHYLPGCRVVDGRLLPQDFIDEMKVAGKPPTVNFVQQMRERKRAEELRDASVRPRRQPSAQRSEGSSGEPDRSEEGSSPEVT